MSSKDIYRYMNLALEQARIADQKGELPVGAILIYGDKIYQAHNSTSEFCNSLNHAELLVINEVINKTGDKILNDAKLFVTLEPCPMCSGAIYLSRISEIYYGAYDSKAGGCGSLFNILPNSNLNHRPKVYGGILEDECSKLIKDFFLRKRNK